MTAEVSSSTPTIVLAPSFRVPIGLGAIALALGFINVWVGLPVGVLAFFLAIQAAWLRVHFTATAFDLYRGQALIRSFPYDQWIHWEIFWFPVPILLYFKEIRSIHFLPILFDPQQLKQSLQNHCPRQTPESSNSTSEH